MFVISPSESVSCCRYRSNAGRALQVNTAVVGTRGVPLPVHNIIVAVAQTIPDLQKKWTRFGLRYHRLIQHTHQISMVKVYRRVLT